MNATAHERDDETLSPDKNSDAALDRIAALEADVAVLMTLATVTAARLAELEGAPAPEADMISAHSGAPNGHAATCGDPLVAVRGGERGAAALERSSAAAIRGQKRAQALERCGSSQRDQGFAGRARRRGSAQLAIGGFLWGRADRPRRPAN